MPQSKIQGKFYPLQHEEFIKLNKRLTQSELAVYLWLKTDEPFGDKLIEASTKQIADDLHVSRRTVQRALVKLRDENLIDLIITKFQYRVKSHPPDDASEPKVKETLRVATPGSPSDTSVAIGTRMSPSVRECRHRYENVAIGTRMSPPQPEIQSEQELENPKINKTYSDFKDSLSESERENFLKFVEEKTKNLEKPINDLEAWLASKNAAKQDRWEVYYERFKIEAKDNLVQIEKLAAKQKAIADFKNRCNLKKREDKFENQQNPVEPESNPTGEGRAIAEFTKLNNLPNEKIESKNPQNNEDQVEQTAEIPGETPDIASSTSEINRLEAKQRAIADFQQRMNVNRPVSEPDPSEINSEEYRQKLAEVNSLLDDSPQSEKSLAQQHREKLAHAKQQQQELARQRREAAAKHSQQQEPDLQRRKEKMLREFEEFNQRDSQRQKSENE